MSFPFSPADIVLSCTICQETLSTIYAHDDRNEGLHKDGEGPNSGKITKLWLTECAHLTCGKHLPGGGAPFHSVHEIPRAPCPLCSVEKDDHSDKALFFVHGISKGQYDENIPDTYVHVPPVQLSGGNPGLEALRFQYLSLLRSGTKIREKLAGLAKALKRWEDKKPEIVRSLSSVAPLRDELLSAGRRLMALGEDVSSVEATLQLAGVSLTEGLHPQQRTDLRFQYHKKDLAAEGQSSSPLDGGSRLARGSAADLDNLTQDARITKGHNEIRQQDSVQQDGSSSKRKRVGSSNDTELQTEYAPRGGAFETCRSRDQMPPPPIPMQQPFAYRARTPSLDWQILKAHHNAIHLPVTPQRHPSRGGFSRSMLAPDSSMEPSNRLSAATRTNNEQSHTNHHQPALVNTGTAEPVYVRGGWQPAPRSFESEGSRCISSPNSSLPSTAQPHVRCSTKYHQGSLIFPVELENRTIDPSSRSYNSASSEGFSSYHGRQSVPARQTQFESPTYSGNHNPSPSRDGRITLSRMPSSFSRHSTNKSIGLFSHVRSSSRQTNHQLAGSSTDRPHLVTTTPAYQRPPTSAQFSAGQPVYSNSLPSPGGPNTQIFPRNNSFDSGPTPVNGEMRHYSSRNNESVLLSHENYVTQKRDRGCLIEPQAFRPRRRANR